MHLNQIKHGHCAKRLFGAQLLHILLFFWKKISHFILYKKNRKLQTIAQKYCSVHKISS